MNTLAAVPLADPVPLVDLTVQHARIASDVERGFQDVLATGAFVLGPAVRSFEADFATYCGVRRVVGVASGTDALELALRAAGIGPGDEVIVPANTFVATPEAVVRAGARVVLADCDEDFLIDVPDVARRVTPRTRAVIPVHLYGQPAPVEALREEVGPDVVIVEDAAQAHGARRQGRRVGSLGDVAATSFYPGKNLGAYGDGGAVVTASDALADAALALRNHGGVRKYEHLVIGTNSRLDSLQAVVLSIKLRVLDAWNAERRAAAARYEDLLRPHPEVITPRVVEGNEHVWHLYVVRVPERDRVLREMNGAGIGAGIHYPAPIHLLPAFAALDQQVGSHPMAERLAGEILSLPIFPGIRADQQQRVVERLTAAIGGR